MSDGYVVIIRQRTTAEVVFKRFMEPGEIERNDDIVLDGVTGYMEAGARASEFNRLPDELSRRAYRQSIIDGREQEGVGDA